MMVGGRKVLVLRKGYATISLFAAFTLPAVVMGQETVPEPPLLPVEAPTGWFGVRISDEAILNESGAAFFDKYPVVSNVDASSPAAKAGVRPGDVLLTFNSHDMRGGSLQLSNWLKPGAPFELRLRRNGAVRVVHGILGRRPEGWEQLMVVQVSPAEQMFRRRSVEGAAPEGGFQQSGLRLRTGGAAPARLPSVLVPALGLGRGIYPFAGAEFTALNNDLCDVLGVSPGGVFVTNVVEGSLARDAGLRAGDVVVMADNIKIENPIDLVRAIRSAEDRSIRLQVIHKRKPQTIVLRW
ncbi:MAG: PDZ domain-containing protein [Gemmatimonadaceae bacterium]